MISSELNIIHHPLGWVLTRNDDAGAGKNRVLSIHPSEAEALVIGQKVSETAEIPIRSERDPTGTVEILQVQGEIRE